MAFAIVLLLSLAALTSVTTASSYGEKLWASNTTIGCPVDTNSGLIVGHANDPFPFVSEYLGIPFAQPPVGPLRFSPPQAYKGNATIIADKQPLSCIQPPSSVNYSESPAFVGAAINSGYYANHTSEDCLYLNVWTKFPAPGAPLKPVIIWFFGGGFHSGGANDPSEQGAIFAEEQDVIMVNFNYRLGIFGFPGAPNTRQNLALLDQRLVVEWVRDNIAGFGGDPDRIIIWGHSAGGASVDFYSYAWIEDPIIAGSSPTSGNTFSFGLRYANTSAQSWYGSASLLGCGNHTTTSDADILACMKKVSATDLLKESNTAGKAVANGLSQLDAEYVGVTGIYGPTIDGITVFKNYTLQGKAGAFIHRPILVGSNDDEACLAAERGQVPISLQDYTTMGVWTCPVYHSAQVRVRAGVKTWQYRYFGAWPNTYASACPGRPWHGQEVNVIFNSTDVYGAPPTAQEMNQGWWYRAAYSAFAHHPKTGLTNLIGWPSLDCGQHNVMVTGLNSTLANYENADIWNKPCRTTFVSGAPDF